VCICLYVLCMSSSVLHLHPPTLHKYALGIHSFGTIVCVTIVEEKHRDNEVLGSKISSFD
jgi:hypothetical protein